MPVAAGDPPEVESIPPNNGELARLLNATEWEVIGALEALFEAATESITIYDLEGRIVRANAAFYASVARLFPGDLPGTLHDRLAQHPPRNPQGAILSEEEWPQTRLLHGETLSGSAAAETMAYTSNGEAVHWSVTGAPLRAADGRLIGAVAIHRDITEQKRLERELRQSRDEAQAILDAVPDQVIVYDTDLHLLRSNAAHSAAVARFHPTEQVPDELPERIQRTRTVFRDLTGAELPPGDWPQQRILRGETLSGASAVETQAYTIAGEAQWWTISGAPLRAEDGTVTGAVLVSTDITRRKELEDALRESETRFRELADYAPLFIWIADEQARVTYANKSLLDYFGAPAHSLVEVGYLAEEVWRRVVHPEDVAALASHHQRALRDPQPWEMEVRFWEAASSMFQWHLVKATPRIVSGQFFGFLGVAINIDDRKRTEDALRASERRLRAALEVLPVGLAFVDAQGKAIVINQAVKTIWGEDVHIAQSRAEYGKYKAWWPQSGKRVKAQEWGLTRALTTGEPQPTDEVEIETFDGKRKTILLANAPILDDSGAVAGGVSVMVDLTERRRLEDELRRSRDELEQRVSERTRELEAANEELARLSHSITRGGVAWALREWQVALDAVNRSVEAELYAAVAELVVAWLQSAQTFESLLEAYFHPDLELSRLIAELCTEGEILLRPHLVMGAACALRLQQIVATIGV
jgi:PAS domain S-box-containing protein